MPTELPRCPFCRSSRAVVGTIKKDLFRCNHCGRQFDTDSDEGGDYFNDPTKRIEMQERQMVRKPGQRSRFTQRRA